MIKVPKNFFISFWERSGSTFLVDLLNQHPQIVCEHEILAGDEAASSRHVPFSHEDALKVLDALYSSPAKPCRGFKFKCGAQQLNFSKLARELYQNRAVIFLYRKNLLKLFISKLNQLALHQRHGVSNISQGQEISLTEKIRWDKSLESYFFRYLYCTLAHNVCVYKNILKAPHDVHVLSYEDLVGQTGQSLDSIFRFLQVETMGLGNPPSGIVKISKDSIAENFEEPAAFLSFVEKTPFKNYLFHDGGDIDSWESSYNIRISDYPEILEFASSVFPMNTGNL